MNSLASNLTVVTVLHIIFNHLINSSHITNHPTTNSNSISHNIATLIKTILLQTIPNILLKSIQTKTIHLGEWIL